jgi:hypothetical protein
MVLDLFDYKLKLKTKKVVPEGIEPSTVALLAQRSNQLSYATSLLPFMAATSYALTTYNSFV